jgi:hypothetical protein
MLNTIEVKVVMDGAVLRSINVDPVKTPYAFNKQGRITDRLSLKTAIKRGESYESLVQLTGNPRTLYRLMYREFGGTLTQLRKRWGVKVERTR